MAYVGAALFPATTGSDIVTGVTSTIGDNAPVVVTLVVFGVGLKIAQKMLNGGLGGKIRVR